MDGLWDRPGLCFVPQKCLSVRSEQTEEQFNNNNCAAGITVQSNMLTTSCALMLTILAKFFLCTRK